MGGEAADGRARLVVDRLRLFPYRPRSAASPLAALVIFERLARNKTMKVRSSLKSLKTRHRDCKIVRRKGIVRVICEVPKHKQRQG